MLRQMLLALVALMAAPAAAQTVGGGVKPGTVPKPPEQVIATTGQPVEVTIEMDSGPGHVRTIAGQKPPLDCKSGFNSSIGMGLCSRAVPVGTKLTLEALVKAGETFKGFASAIPGCNGPKCSFTVTGRTKIIARFKPPSKTLTIKWWHINGTEPVLKGVPKLEFFCVEAELDPQKIAKDSVCTAEVPAATNVTITSVNPLMKWMGCPKLVGNACTIVVNQTPSLYLWLKIPGQSGYKYKPPPDVNPLN